MKKKGIVSDEWVSDENGKAQINLYTLALTSYLHYLIMDNRAKSFLLSNYWVLLWEESQRLTGILVTNWT